ncbi:hypothetical protein D3C87_1953100 [compost metagenome]
MMNIIARSGFLEVLEMASIEPCRLFVPTCTGRRVLIIIGFSARRVQSLVEVGFILP